MPSRILVVDDEQSMRTYLEILLAHEGYSVSLAPDVPSASEKLRAGEFDLVLTDLRLGRGSGLQVLKTTKELHPLTEVIVMTAYSSGASDLEAMKMGAYDYVSKPFRKNDELLLLIRKALEKRALAIRGLSLEEDNERLRSRLAGRASDLGMVGHGRAMQEVFSLIERVAAAKTTVLITGESGVGKELVARAIHRKSPRSAQPFIPVNCGAIPEGLIESELFGHVKGAFTGAHAAREGLFVAAHGGTLFLDEIVELPLALQVRLLRAIQERRIRAVGGVEDVEVDVRLLAATNRGLEGEVKAGRFREDLFYRLNVIQIRVPALRERREDVHQLAEHFLARFSSEQQRAGLKFSREAKRRLDEYSFPGNVRELENLIERAVTLAEGPEITLDAFPSPLRPAPAVLSDHGALPPGFSLENHLASIEAALLQKALEQAGGVKKSAASLLGLTFRQFRHRLSRLDPTVGSLDVEGTETEELD